jgi:hypothetical protein
VPASIADEPEDEPQYILLQHNKRDKKIFHAYRVDVNTSAAALRQRGVAVEYLLKDNEGPRLS